MYTVKSETFKRLKQKTVFLSYEFNKMFVLDKYENTIIVHDHWQPVWNGVVDLDSYKIFMCQKVFPFV